MIANPGASVPPMARHVRLREVLVGIEGLAVLRQLYDGSDAELDRRVAEIARLLADDSLSAAELTSEEDPRTAYELWAGTYDDPGNPIVAIEEPVVHALLDGSTAGRALDAACGTGRHARYLADRGHDVLGVDVSPTMLGRAAQRVPEATLLEGDLCEIPAPDGHFDVAVCGLALSHLADVRPGVAELARVLKPGGRLVISVLHPFQAHLGWQAPFTDSDGRRRFAREHAHTHAQYLSAFRSVGLDVRGCEEPALQPEHVLTKRRAFGRIPDATVQAYVGLPAVLVWDLRARE